MPVLLVRHAHAGSRRDWPGDDRLRPLSSQGERQAEGLVRLVDRWEPTGVLSSPYRRCVQTVEPLAGKLGLEVIEDPALEEEHGGAALRLVRSLAEQVVLLCTHGDVIAEVLVALADEDRVDLGPRPRQAKGSVWVLEGVGERFVTASYLPPPG